MITMTSLLELELEAKKAKLEQAEKRRGSDSPYVTELKMLSTVLEEEDKHPTPGSSGR
jgi:hypothetical protein